MLKNLSRPLYEKDISNFLFGSSKNSGFAYVRGRRRVGKSTILKHIATENPKKVFWPSSLMKFNGLQRGKTVLWEFLRITGLSEREPDGFELLSADLRIAFLNKMSEVKKKYCGAFAPTTLLIGVLSLRFLPIL